MTREEMEELKGLAASMGLYDDKHPCKRAVILGKAIKALEQEPCENAISREDALMALTGEWTGITDKKIHRVIKRIKALPPVNPQYAEDEIQKMQDLEQAELEKAYELGKAEGQKSEDAISRQAVLDMMQMRMGGKELYKAVYDLPPVNPQPKYEDIAKAFQFGLAFGFGEKHDEMDEVIDEINKKVITPQPKTGHWINIDATHSKCNRCEAVFEIVSENGEVNYCPNCGAKMVEPQKGANE